MQSRLLRACALACLCSGAALAVPGCTLPTGTLPGNDGGARDTSDFDAAGDTGAPDVGPGDAGAPDAGPCTTDATCGAGAYCASGTCMPTHVDGTRCTGANECASTFCVDGVCCDRACDGACEGCTGARRGAGFDGECGPVAAGTDPDDECATQAEASCGTSGSCDGAGACARWPLGTVCSSETCSSGVAQPERMCDGAGTCNAVSTTTCSPYACGASACLTSCTTDAECDASAFCSGGSCVSQRPEGAACARANDCASGFCVDGVCCGSACAGSCSACAAALTGGADGTCAPIALGTDPDMECAASSASSCGTDGACDGAGACSFWSATTVCVAASCASGVESDARLCDGAGTCVAGGSRACPPYVCAGTACATSCASDVDCTTGNYCSGTACTPKLSNGLACTGAAECLSGSCVDGFCCNTACAGTCVACAAARTGGVDGVCAAIPTGSDPDDECAASAASSCGTDGACDGSGACRLWAGGTECAPQACAGGDQVNADLCDGAGHCVDHMTTACAPYLCAGTACPTTCASDAACSAGNYCDGTGHCALVLASGGVCARGAQCASGNCVDGVCCATACTGTCMACSAAMTGAASGTCAPIVLGTDPQNECAAMSASTCGTEGNCDGAGACALWASGTSCVAASCTSGVAQRVDQCNGSGTCVDGGTVACAPYVCSGAACGTSCASDTDCAAGNFCSGSACVAKLSNGGACTAANQCTSGSCVDGFCCNTSCTGTCSACSAAMTGGANGVCAAIVAGTDPQNECAASAASSCGLDGQCSGAGACRFWAGGTSTGSLCDGADTDACLEGPLTCDGAGGTSCGDLSADSVETCNGLDDDCDGVIDDGAGCPCPVTNFGGHAYMLCAASTDWDAARAACMAGSGYDLAAITSAPENAFAAGLIAVDGVSPWVGATDLPGGTTYAWTTGESFTFTNWTSGSPTGAGDCVALLAADGTWDDLVCTGASPYLCESLP